MSDELGNLPDIGALAAQDGAVGLAEPSADPQPTEVVSHDPTDANQALLASLSSEEIAALQAADQNGAGQIDPAGPAPQEVAPPAPQAPQPQQPHLDPTIAVLLQNQQALMQYMQQSEAQSRALVDSFKAEVAAFRPKEPEKPKSDIEIFQEETLRKAREAVRQDEVAPLMRRLEALEGAARNKKIEDIAASRLSEARTAAQQVFGDSVDNESIGAVQELTLALAYGYELPADKAASLAKNLVNKAVDSHMRSLKKKAQTAAAQRPVRAPPVPQATVAAGGTGGVAGKLPAWFTQE